MSQRIVGLDIGAARVRAVVLETSFRSFQLVEVVERALPPYGPTVTEEGRWQAIVETLAKLREDEVFEADTVVCSLPGECVVTRTITFPFTDVRQIEATIGFELEGFLPYSVDEIVYDYQIIGRTDATTTLFVSAAPREVFEAFLARLEEAGLDPRMVEFGGSAYVNVLRQLDEDAPSCVAVIDLGAERTDVSIVDANKMVSARTIRRGGSAVTQSIAEALDVTPIEAESIKRVEGVVAPEGQTLASDRSATIAAASREGLAPVVRAMKQTLHAYAAGSPETTVSHVLVCGGASQLRGLREHLAGALGLPVEPLSVAHCTFNRLEDPSQIDDGFQKGLGLGLRSTVGGAGGEVNFRRGQYAYAGDFQYLREKVAYLLVLSMMLLGIAGVRAYNRYGILVDTQDQQRESLREFSLAVLGEESDDFDSVLTTLRDVSDESSLRFFPQMTAKTVLLRVTTVMQDVNDTSAADLRRMRGEKEKTGGGAVPTADPALAPPVQPPGGEPLPGAGVPPVPVPGALRPMPPLPGVRPPGPAQSSPPMPGVAVDRDERLKRLREARELRGLPAIDAGLRARTSRGVIGSPPALPPGLTADLANLRSNRDAARAAKEEPAPPTAGSGGGPVPVEDVATSTELAPEERLIVELETVQIGEMSTHLKGEANSLEAATLLEQKLGKVRCFRNVVLEGTDKITFERHRGWYTFQIAFDIDCDEPKKNGSDGKGKD